MAIDPDKLTSFMGKLVGDLGAMASIGPMLIGEKLGLYKTLAAGGAMTPAELAQATDKTPVIMKAALDNDPPCDIAVATLNTFVSVLGAEAGNLALKVLATGGVYLGGGIPPRILSYLSSERFMQSFRNKGRLGKLLTTIPVHVILNPKIALLGAALHGFEVTK